MLVSTLRELAPARSIGSRTALRTFTVKDGSIRETSRLFAMLCSLGDASNEQSTASRPGQGRRP
jgi:hypothetical protein